MILICNPIGLMMCFVPAVLASFTWTSFPRGSHDIWTLVGAWGAVTFLSDVIYRLLNRDEPWYSPRRGGHIFFVPVCLLGTAALWWYAQRALQAGYWLPKMTEDPNSLIP